MYTLSEIQQANFLSTDFMAVATDSTVSAAAVDGGVNIAKIKTAGSGGANGTHTGVAIRGDGSSGVASVTVAGGAVTTVLSQLQEQDILLHILEMVLMILYLQVLQV